MKRILLKSKLHRATVTGAELEYEGSVTIDRDLLEAADLVEYEQVQIYDITNGARLTTYVICGDAGSGEVCINGAAAHLVRPGDLVIVASYGEFEAAEARTHVPRIMVLDEDNRLAGNSEPQQTAHSSGRS